MQYGRIALPFVATLAWAGSPRLHADETGSPDAPGDPLFERQWYLENPATDADIDVLEAWRVTRGSPDVTIAVIDDGVDLAHPDLAPNIIGPGRDFTPAYSGSNARPKRDADRHGTSVAGLAAARGNDGVGIAGVCPGCSLLAIRAPREAGEATAAAFRYAVEAGADVIVNSWGYTRTADDDAVAAAIEFAATEGRGGRGAVVVFGVTNELVDNCGPGAADIASLDAVIAVGVADHRDRIGFSGYGACLDLVAPAKPRYRSTAGVLTTDLRGLAGHSDGDYFPGFGGTSAAAPLVAGVAGLLLSLNPELDRSEIQHILEHTADEIDAAQAGYEAGFSPRAGHGRVNAGRALTPAVRVRVSPHEVRVGQPFDLTVTASAPLGIGRVSWKGHGAAAAHFGWTHDTVDGRAYYARTWRGLSFPLPGTYRFEATARGAAAGTHDPDRAHSDDVGVEGLVTVRGAEP